MEQDIMRAIERRRDDQLAASIVQRGQEEEGRSLLLGIEGRLVVGRRTPEESFSVATDSVESSSRFSLDCVSARREAVAAVRGIWAVWAGAGGLFAVRTAGRAASLDWVMPCWACSHAWTRRMVAASAMGLLAAVVAAVLDAAFDGWRDCGCCEAWLIGDALEGDFSGMGRAVAET